jgi:glutathione synthase/RimK-type ligase-like ATP-grasp enzyme
LVDRKTPIELVIQQAMSLKFPLVIKPNRGSHGDGIIFDIASPGQLLQVWQQCVES